VAVRASTRVLVEPLGRWLEPHDALRAVAGEGAFLLAAGSGGRWSYLAPPQTGQVIEDPTGAGALAEARSLLREHACERDPAGPPFQGGLVGSLGYDLARVLERLPVLARDDLGLPAVHLRLVERVIAFDHEEGEVLLCARDERSLAELHDDIFLARAARTPEPPGDGAPLDVVDYPTYRRRFERVLRHIQAGDVYQVNLTHRMTGPCDSAVALALRLAESAAVPYGCYLDAGRVQIAGASPERFVRVRPDGLVETRPMKGTRPRGATPADDDALARELSRSAKDRAENVMIVDLARNDLSRTCLPGTVHVPSLLTVERHPTVHQLVSTVHGRLAPGRDALDAVAAAFPPGSMTGAPKVRAMELIEELEPVRRGPYAGAFGWFGHDGACDLAVVIRTAVVVGGQAHLHVGGAIVADSLPRDEYDESLLKARTVATALGARVPAG
jgi:para-aminobenzoate synthetase component 1